MARLVAKVFIDQALFAPVLLLSFFALNAAFDGAGWHGFRSKVGAEFWRALRLNYAIWPAATLVNFALVPTHLQILFANVVALFWTSILISVTQG